MSSRLHVVHCRTVHKLLLMLAPPLILAGCTSVPLSTPPDDAVPQARTGRKSSSLPVLPPAGSGKGGYYKDDGPGDAPPEGLLDTPDAEPTLEPYSRWANRPYVVFGKSYTPVVDERPFKQRGIGSWYGRKFHGQKTSSGEIYDMYKMTAAHPTLPIPSYARVTNISNGRQVIVRINDRGPFHAGRVIDLSYTAALKLGYLSHGSSELEVERLLRDDILRLQAGKNSESAGSQANAAVEVMPVAASQPITRIEISPAPVVPAVAVAATNATMIATTSATSATTVTTTAATAPASASASTIADAPRDSTVILDHPAALAPGYYVQLASYGKSANAHAAKHRLAQHPVARIAPLEVVESGAWYRLYSGPYATRGDAASAALKLQDGGAGKPLIVQR